MLADKEKELCPRLIDYLVVVGKRCRLKDPNDGRENQSHSSHSSVTYPEILRRYPTNNHKDFPLPAEVTVFCQPEGCSTITSTSSQLQNRDPLFFVFQLTEKDSAKIRYGVCLNFYQSLEKREVSEVSLKHKRRELSLTSICLISHHPFVSLFHDILVILRNIIDCCNARAQSKVNVKNVIWSVLTGNWSESIPPEAMDEMKEIETWILMLLSAPVPVPGRTKVQLEILPPHISPNFELSLPDHTRFNLVDFPIHLPFELLGIDLAVQVLTAIMLEFKVVIQSRNYNAVSMCVLSMINLLYPLEYMFPVIPLLPTFLASAEQILLAPTPFVIGVPALFFVHKKIKQPNDIILVDLDSCQLHIPDDLCIPTLPEPEASNLKKSVSDAMHEMNMSLVIPRTPLLDRNYSLESDTTDVRCRVAMVKFFNSPNIFGDFSEHTRTLRLYPRPVVALQTESFLRSRPNQTQFIVDLCRTQAVEYFAEYCLCPSNETFVRVQAGIEAASLVGDKSRWYADGLMPVHFVVYPNNSTIFDAIQEFHPEKSDEESDGEEQTMSTLTSSSSLNDLICDRVVEIGDTSLTKPLAEVNDVYKEPLALELPTAESIDSLSSGQSTPSSMSTSAMDSEVDFARLANNLALKSNSNGSFSFDHADDDVEMTPVPQNRKTFGGIRGDASADDASFASSTPSRPSLPIKGFKGFKSFTDSGEKMLGQNLMFTINGYAERSQDIISQVIGKTAPRAQALKERAIAPLGGAGVSFAEHTKIAQPTKPSIQSSVQAATQQTKNQQTVREICDQVLQGQGVGVFTYNKLRKLMEDESLRELACSKLNLGLDTKLQEEEFVKEVQLSRAQYKGYLRVLQACIAGLEVSFKTPGCCGMASTFHILEIAHTHYWCKNATATPTNVTQRPEPITPQDMRSPDSALTSPRDPEILSAKTSISSISSGSLIGQPPESTAPKRQPPPVPPRVPPRPAPPSTAAPPKPSTIGSEVPAPPRTAPPPPPLPGRPSEQRAPPPPPRPSNAPSNGSTSSGPAPSAPPPPARPNGSVNSSEQPATAPPPFPPPKKLSVEQLANGSANKSSTATTPATPDRSKTMLPASLSLGLRKITPSSYMVADATKYFLFQDVILPAHNPLWQNLVYWENVFVDIVAQEREIVGMDEEPSEMIDRYIQLSDVEKKRLELDEDRLLGTLLHNLTSYMVMCGTGQQSIQMKVRRLLGKAHVGLICSQEINRLLDDLPTEQSNAIPLKPLGSRLLQKLSFAVYLSANTESDMMFVDVCEDAMVVRAVTGAVVERWWYERLVNMTYSPKTKILCIWRRQDDKVHMHTFHTKKCKELYDSLVAAMKRAADRGQYKTEDRALGGEFPIHDVERNEGGLIQVRSDGIVILFETQKDFIDLKNIKKCNTFGGNIFLLEEYNRETGEVNARRFYSNMADQITYAVLCVFSVAAAQSKHVEIKNFVEK